MPDIVADNMRKIGQVTGRQYRPFEYFGDSDADNIIIAMGSVCDTIKETIGYLQSKGEKAGLLQVRLYRPFSEKYFLHALPPSAKRIAVLDRTKEPGATGEPLYLDICRMFTGAKDRPLIVGGRYGLGSKDVNPSQILAVFANLREEAPKNGFTIGINDDVTKTSLRDLEYQPDPHGTVSCQFWGLGSDGTVGANKTACKIIGENTDLNVQAYFSYDSKKSGGTTISHLRFGREPILSSYLVYQADYVACHNKSFLNHYDLLGSLKPGGIFVLNCDYSPEELSEQLPGSLKRYLARNHIKLYIIDALKIASDIGLGNRINMVMQSAFFQLANILPQEEAIRLLKESIHKAYGRKGQNIEEMNVRAVDEGAKALVKIEIPREWADAVEEKNTADEDAPEFANKIMKAMARNEGSELPVSAFEGMEDGAFPPGTTKYEQRGIAPTIPEWQMDKCIQCGQCSYVCPHATVRLFLLDEDEQRAAPESFKTKAATGKGLEGYHLRVQVSPLDCTGCGNCADVCPPKEKALIMKPAQGEIDKEDDNWEFAMTLREKPDLIDRFTVKGSQFLRPLLEFNGACPGCGEPAYVRLLTQLFGERMMIANATGCSSIWGASAPSMAYCTNEKGRGPAWANSLFEDNAEYGYGMCLGVKQIRMRLASLVRMALNSETLEEELQKAFLGWLQFYSDGPKSQALAEKIRSLLEKTDCKGSFLLQQIKDASDYLEKRSIWMIGGDGWAYDIGYGGVDHVISTGEDVNLFIMDTEVYSNTGGQASKATPTGAVAKFAFNGKLPRKKNLGLMAMSYKDVYVAQISMCADFNQTVKAMKEAESYNGPSVIIAYAPCISHGIKSGMAKSIREEKKAVETGYWNLYRYDPRRREEGKNPFQMDSKDPTRPYREFLDGEIRYSQLFQAIPERASMLFEAAEEHSKERLETYKRMSED
ncbi:Pyruvate synthase [bioreactor metagenome]|uniref:Pyruvate synthase n=1 Tax=bioreactor metagenome TaxID=1076179 RepID=A0A644XWW4_9ZZZZ